MQLTCWPKKKEDAMRMWIMLGAGALMLAAVVLPSGVWGATIDDVKAEMAKMSSPPGTRLDLRIPREIEENARMPIDQLCVSGGRLRPIGGGPAGAVPGPTDLGPVRPGNQYSVAIVQKSTGSATGDEKMVAERIVSIPDCK